MALAEIDKSFLSIEGVTQQTALKNTKIIHPCHQNNKNEQRDFQQTRNNLVVDEMFLIIVQELLAPFMIHK